MSRPGEDEAIEAAAKALAASFGSATRVMYAERAVVAAYPVIAAAVLADVLALCDAADEAALRPDVPGFEPIEVPWTVAIRAIVAAAGPGGADPKETDQ